VRIYSGFEFFDGFKTKAFDEHCKRSRKIFLVCNVKSGSAGAWVTLEIKREHEFMLKQCKKLFQEFRYQ
jgi:hypothetical protein